MKVQVGQVQVAGAAAFGAGGAGRRIGALIAEVEDEPVLAEGGWKRIADVAGGDAAGRLVGILGGRISRSGELSSIGSALILISLPLPAFEGAARGVAGSSSSDS